MSFDEMHERGGPSTNTLARYANWEIGDDEWKIRPASFRAFDLALGLEPGGAAELFEQADVDPGVVVVDTDTFATVVAERVCAMLAERLGRVS